MNEKLIEAFFDAPHVVLKRRLRPFTLRHAFILSAGDNAFFSEAEPTIGDVYQAVEVCSRDGRFFFHSEPSRIKRKWLEIRNLGANYIAEALKLQAYFEDYTASPTLWTKEGGGKASKCHWIISTVANLMARFSMTRDEAWSLTPGEATWYIVAAYEADPWVSVDVMSDEEARFIASMKED